MKSKQLNLQGFLDKAVVYGAGAVQMDPCWPSQDLNLSPDSLAYLRHELEARGLQIVVKGNSGGLGSLANSPVESASEVEFFRTKIEAAAYLGASVVRIVTRAYPYPTDHTKPPAGVARQEVIGWVIENLSKLTPHAKANGVRIAIENHGDLRIAEIERILGEVHSPWLGVQFDVLEQVAIFEDPGLAGERLLPHAFTIHWNDAYPRLRNSGFCVMPCLPGRGIIDLDGVFRKIASLSQDIFIFIAFQADPEASEDDLVRAYLDDLHYRLNHIRSNQ